MYIHEAIKEAIISGCMVAKVSNAEYRFKPSKKNECIIMRGKESNTLCYWAPSANDLIADDWYVTSSEIVGLAYIHEAIKEALVDESLIARASHPYCKFKPTNTHECIIIQGDEQSPAPCWSPSIEDLIADDWYVIRQQSLL